MASPSLGEAEHNLMNTIARTGTKVYIDCPDDANFMGIYSSTNSLLAVCNDGKDPSDWTAEERDTLRHEAIHFAQDCMGMLHDGTLETTQSITTLMRVVHKSGIPAAEIESIYRQKGADDMTIVLEMEAFSLARLLTTAEVEMVVERSCFPSSDQG
jgi:hypothetical protein